MMPATGAAVVACHAHCGESGPLGWLIALVVVLAAVGLGLLIGWLLDGLIDNDDAGTKDRQPK